MAAAPQRPVSRVEARKASAEAMRWQHANAHIHSRVGSRVAAPHVSVAACGPNIVAVPVGGSIGVRAARAGVPGMLFRLLLSCGMLSVARRGDRRLGHEQSQSADCQQGQCILEFHVGLFLLPTIKVGVFWGGSNVAVCP